MGLEERVTAKLRELDDTTLDRVARAYARSRFPDRFNWIDGLGVNDEGQPIGGRPDAFVRAPDGHLDRIETTRHAKKSEIRNKTLTGGHFPSILANICQSGDGGGLVYVAGHPKIQFTPQDIADMTNAAVAAGLQRERIHIVGGDALADALCRPELASVRIRLLGVGDPKQFDLVRRELSPDQRRLSRPSRPNPFIPTAEDLDADTVYFPSVGIEVERQLREQRICFVRGLGASGKSVMAWLVGLRWGASGDPAYLVDLQTIASDPGRATRECIEDLKLMGAANALFVLDNCHLEEVAARQIHLAWEEIGEERPALLLVGRETQSRSGSRMFGVNVEPLLLRAQQPEVSAVFQRLAARHLRYQGDHSAPPNPPGDVLNRWVSTFGGNPLFAKTTTDLIAFSAAVQRRIGELLRENWALTEEDAAEEIRTHYIVPLTEPERKNLYLLALVQKIEMQLPHQALFDITAGLSHCIEKLGIVFTGGGGASPSNPQYQLAHAALSKLIIKASNENFDEAEAYKRVAATSGTSALHLVGRLKAAGRNTDINAVRGIMLVDPQVLIQMPLNSAAQFLVEILQVTDHPAQEAFFGRLAAGSLYATLVRVVANSPLCDVAAFLRNLERSNLPAARALHQTMATQLCKKSQLDALTKSAISGHPHFVADFLRYLERSNVRTFTNLHKMLVAQLSDASRFHAFVMAAASSAIGDLTGFLRYLEESASAEVQTLFSAFLHELTTPEVQAALATTASHAFADQLEGFLNFVNRRQSLHPLVSALAESLGTKKLASAVAESLGTKEDDGDLMACQAETMIMEADVWFGRESYERSIARLKAVEALFGASTSPPVQAVVKDATFLLASFYAAFGRTELAIAALEACKASGMTNLRELIDREFRFRSIWNTSELTAVLSSGATA